MRYLSALPLLLLPCVAGAQSKAPGLDEDIRRYETDRNELRSFYFVRSSAKRLQRLDRLGELWQQKLQTRPFDELPRGYQVDWLLFRNHLEAEAKRRDRTRARLAVSEDLLPFADDLIRLEEARWRMSTVDLRKAAATLNRATQSITELRKAIEAASEDEPTGETRPTDPVEALRVARRIGELRRVLEEWFEQHDGFLPGFHWWVADSYEALSAKLEDYAKFLRSDVAGIEGEEDDPLVGDPIGRDALLAEIEAEMLAYEPEELVAIGEAEFAWCEQEMQAAAQELGFGDDWRQALQHVKELHADPGEQGRVVTDQALEMIQFLETNDLLTIPELCKEVWRIEMIDEGVQKTLPYAAYGGQKMLVAYPTREMDFESKEMALRGNNVHFTRAVTPHELIPGHHLQRFMSRRHSTHRRIFGTPFYGEGWAVYWEMVEYDRGWPQSAEDRIGMLFWRMHRAARIIVSLGFHLEAMTPEEMIDFLVERVGHERDAATSEVRRYVGDGYGPLYQCAYMIGALQLRALHGELVGTGKMTDREYHDAIMKQNSIPIEMVRAALTEEPLQSDYRPRWRFAGDVKPSTRFNR